MKPKIKIIDKIFSHAPISFGVGDLKGIEPKYFDWYRGDENINDIVVITETSAHLVDSCNEKIKILLIVESPLINPEIYQSLRNPEYAAKWTYVFTFSKDLVAVNPEKFKYYQFLGCWIYKADQMIHAKNKNISIVSSAKTITEGHRLRHEAIAKFRDKIEGIYGGGYQFVENKITALKEFRYSIVIENDNCDGMTSEKAIDCFVTGTIPIYWGNKSIGDHFNRDGVLCFNTIEELGKCIEMATPEYYESKMPAIKENFEIATKCNLPEDDMWKTL